MMHERSLIAPESSSRRISDQKRPRYLCAALSPAPVAMRHCCAAGHRTTAANDRQQRRAATPLSGPSCRTRLPFARKIRTRRIVDSSPLRVDRSASSRRRRTAVPHRDLRPCGRRTVCQLSSTAQSYDRPSGWLKVVKLENDRGMAFDAIQLHKRQPFRFS